MEEKRTHNGAVLRQASCIAANCSAIFEVSLPPEVQWKIATAPSRHPRYVQAGDSAADNLMKI